MTAGAQIQPGAQPAALLAAIPQDVPSILQQVPGIASYEHLQSHIAYEHTIPRMLAHKQRLENVYVTSLAQIADSDFLFGAFVPQSNVHLNELRAHPNDVTLAIIEIGRQIGLALSHRFLGVEQGQAFILNDMHFDMTPAWRSIDWRSQETVWGYARLDSHRYSDAGELTAVRADGQFYVGDRVLCRQASHWTIQPRERYQRLRKLTQVKSARRRRAVTATPDDFTGGFRLSASPQQQRVLEDTIWADVAGQRFAASLHVDRRNLFFFDHDNDHVPGMLVLEGMRRFAAETASRYREPGRGQSRLRSIHVGFRNFAEIDEPVRLIASVSREVRELAPGVIHIEARQDERIIAVGRFEVS